MGTEASVLAKRCGISEAAVALARDAELIDLHLDSFIPVRIFGYDLEKAHTKGLLGGRFFGHLDFPRLQDAGLKGGHWSITTNPLRSAAGRWKAVSKNLSHLTGLLQDADGFAVVTDGAEFERARSRGEHGGFLAVQGGNCFDAMPEGSIDRRIVRVTVLHLTNSALGCTSSPQHCFRKNKGLTERGRAFVRRLNQDHVFVDLAHIHPDGFWDAVQEHDASQPLLVTHTGVSKVHKHWRNIDDQQIKAVADTGGTIGIMFSQLFLGQDKEGAGPGVIDHMDHIIRVVGEDFVSIGSDYDGAIIPPLVLRSGDAYACLVQDMMDLKWSEMRIRKILGGNFLRGLRQLRG